MRLVYFFKKGAKLHLDDIYDVTGFLTEGIHYKTGDYGAPDEEDVDILKTVRVTVTVTEPANPADGKQRRR